MDEKEKEQALEDLKVIKRIMGATNRVGADNGLSFILTGAFLLINCFLYFIIRKFKIVAIIIPFFFLWVVMFYPTLFTNTKFRQQFQADWAKVPPRIKRQMSETVLVILASGVYD